MKMRPEHYQTLRAGVRAVLDRNPNYRENYTGRGWSDTRLVFDAFHASKPDYKVLYDYLTDSHIETALRSILREYEGVAA